MSSLWLPAQAKNAGARIETSEKSAFPSHPEFAVMRGPFLSEKYMPPHRRRKIGYPKTRRKRRTAILTYVEIDADRPSPSHPIVISPPLPPVLLVEVSSIDSCLRHEAGLRIHNQDRKSGRDELT